MSQKHKSERNILIAFILNLSFSIYEFIGGAFTGSVAIISDAVHDIGDAMSIGISYFLERKSKKQPNEKYSYGYQRFSALGSLITTVILLVGSIFVIYSAIGRIIHPVEIRYDGMIILAIIGVIVNFLAAWFTHDGDSLNQKSVNLHMLEDVLGWVVVLIGAIVMRFTDFSIIDPILSIGVAIFIFKSAFSNFCAVMDVFLEKTPRNLSISKLEKHLLQLPDVEGVHHMHVWSMDGYQNYTTLHVVSKNNTQKLKNLIRAELAEHNIVHATIEIESPSEACAEQHCEVKSATAPAHHHHHH